MHRPYIFNHKNLPYKNIAFKDELFFVNKFPPPRKYDYFMNGVYQAVMFKMKSPSHDHIDIGRDVATGIVKRYLRTHIIPEKKCNLDFNNIIMYPHNDVSSEIHPCPIKTKGVEIRKEEIASSHVDNCNFVPN